MGEQTGILAMTEGDFKSHWRDWTLFGLYWLFLVVISLTILLSNAQNGVEIPVTDLAVGFAIGTVINLILAGMIVVEGLNRGIPYMVILGSWILVAAYTIIVQAEAILITGAAGTLIMIGLLYLGPGWGSVQTIGAIISSILGIAYVNDFENLASLPDTYLLPMAIIALIAISTGAWVYARHQGGTAEQKALRERVGENQQQIEDMRERIHALSDMSVAMTGTLNFERILDSALDIGRMSLRGDIDKQRMVSIVMLFRSDGTLQFVTSRGLNHIDEHRHISGTDGIIAEALDEGMPTVGKDPYKDPELKPINGFQGLRSILVIPLRAHYDNYGALVYASSAPDAFNTDHVDTLNAIGVQATIALQNAVLYNNLMAEKERIIQMEEDARKALVRDLHDIPTQTISAVAMRIRIAQRMMEKTPDEVMPELKNIEEMALRATEEIRHVLFKLRPLALESQGIAAALDQLSEKMQKTFGQAMAVRVHPDVDAYLDTTQQGALFYLIEEAANNARKYAQAEIISVTIAPQDNHLVVRIVDNGIGFDTESVNAKYDERGSFGMINMRERAELIDGRLSLKSVPGKGTAITVMIPIERVSSEKERARKKHIRSIVPNSKLGTSAMHDNNG